MNAETQFLCPDPAEPAATYSFGPAEARYDGWTPDKQTMFLRTISEGHSITYACRVVGMSTQSAYALRRAARGAGFALGWQGALILGRERLADEMLDRVLNGVVETITHPDGRITERHRHDNRLGAAMLARMDRVADATRADPSHAAARLVAADFDQYLDLIGRDGGPARAGLFLGVRAEAATETISPRSARSPAPTNGCAPTPISPSRSTPAISIPPPAQAGPASNGSAPKRRGWSSSPRPRRPHPKTRAMAMVNFVNRLRSIPIRTSRSGGTMSRRDGARTFLRPRISSARRTANMAMTAIRAR